MYPPPQLDVHPTVTTFIGLSQVTVPFWPVNVPTNVMLEGGKMVIEPPETGLVEPTPPVMKPLVTLALVQETTTLWPVLMVEGETEMVQAGAGPTTVMVVWQVFVAPNALVTVMV